MTLDSEPLVGQIPDTPAGRQLAWWVTEQARDGEGVTAADVDRYGPEFLRRVGWERGAGQLAETFRNNRARIGDLTKLDVESAQALMAQADALEMSGKLGDALAACRDAVQRAERTPNALAIALARLAAWRLAGSSNAPLPGELKAAIADLRNPELDLWVQYAGAIRAKRAGVAGSRQLFQDLATAAANRGYVTLSRRALALGDSP